MADETIYTEEELSKMADELLSASDEPELIPEPPKTKKSARKKESAEEGSSKTPEERLNDLLEKGKKSGKLSSKELKILDDMNIDGEAIENISDAATDKHAEVWAKFQTACGQS